MICASGIGHSWFVRATTYLQNSIVVLKLCALILFLGVSLYVSGHHDGTGKLSLETRLTRTH